MKPLIALLFLVTAFSGLGCSTRSDLPELEPLADFDLERFMGKWHVVANIPTFIEKKAWGPIEEYNLKEDGTVKTTYSFRKDSCTGELKSYESTGFPISSSVWKMQFLWPFKMDYRVLFIDDNYSLTIVGRKKRDYLWIMSREPIVGQESLKELKNIALKFGYEFSEIQDSPQCE